MAVGLDSGTDGDLPHDAALAFLDPKTCDVWELSELFETECAETPFLKTLCCTADYGTPALNRKWGRWVCTELLTFYHGFLWEGSSIGSVIALARVIMARPDFQTVYLYPENEGTGTEVEQGRMLMKGWSILGCCACHALDEFSDDVDESAQDDLLCDEDETASTSSFRVFVDEVLTPFFMEIVNYPGYRPTKKIEARVLQAYTDGRGFGLAPPGRNWGERRGGTARRPFPLDPSWAVAAWNRDSCDVSQTQNGDFLFVLACYRGEKNPVCDRLRQLSGELVGN